MGKNGRGAAERPQFSHALQGCLPADQLAPDTISCYFSAARSLGVPFTACKPTRPHLYAFPKASPEPKSSERCCMCQLLPSLAQSVTSENGHQGELEAHIWPVLEVG